MFPTSIVGDARLPDGRSADVERIKSPFLALPDLRTVSRLGPLASVRLLLRPDLTDMVGTLDRRGWSHIWTRHVKRCEGKSQFFPGSDIPELLRCIDSGTTTRNTYVDIHTDYVVRQYGFADCIGVCRAGRARVPTRWVTVVTDQSKSRVVTFYPDSLGGE